jgi:hypothetical protein
MDTEVEFQRRRRRAIAVAVPLFAAGGVLVATVELVGGGWDAKELLLGLGTAGMMFGGLAYLSICRCPQCGAVPEDGEGIPFNPKQCQKCGATFR